MKFSHHLASLEPKIPAQFHGKLLDYRALKKALKSCSNGTERLQAEESFFALLEEQVMGVSKYVRLYDFCSHNEVEVYAATPKIAHISFRAFILEAKRIIKAQKALLRPSIWSRLCWLCTGGPFPMDRVNRLADLAEQSAWCRRFARINGTALRKIVKKHDKQCHNDRGRRFLQAGQGLSTPCISFLTLQQHVCGAGFHTGFYTAVAAAICQDGPDEKAGSTHSACLANTCGGVVSCPRPPHGLP
jgi:SPX domain protein involved in polyphosphate accumulation